jgi:predicted permease
MSGIVQDLRYALRGLRKSPSFAIVAVLTLALGIGANTAMFTVLNAALLRPLPYPSPEQLVMLWTERSNQDLQEGRSAFWDVEQWRTQSKTLLDVAVFDPVSIRLTAPGEVERIGVVRVSPNYFQLFGVIPARGRMFSREEADQRRRVAVISHRFWQSRFAGAPDVIGRTIELDGVRSEVVGVLGADFGSDSGADVWEPHTMFQDWETRRGVQGAPSWLVLARLRPAVTAQQAQTELSAVARRLDQQRPAAERGRTIGVEPLHFHVVGARTRLALWMLSGAVFCVLLIAVTNITSLSLSRNAGRVREIALRTALGATSMRILRQMFIESVTLAVLSGLVGIFVAAASIRVIVALRPGDLALLDGLGLDTSVLGLSLGLSILTGILVGLIPSLTTSRSMARPALNEASRGSSVGTCARFARRALVVAEFALAVVLLVGAGLLIRSMINVQATIPGFGTDRVLSLQLALPDPLSDEQRIEYYRQVLEQVEAVPGVEDAGTIGDLFISGGQEQSITVDAGDHVASSRLRLRRDEISNDLFSTLQVPLLRGRGLSAEDGPMAPRAAIINDTTAQRLWPGADAVGKRFRLGDGGPGSPWFTVVGIVGDMRRQGLEEDPVAQMFEPVAQNPSRLATLLVRTSTEPLSMAAAIRSAIHRVDRQVPVYGVTTLEDRLVAAQAGRRFQTSVLIAFAAVALLLAAIGIYGVIQYSTKMRTREIGLRMAVGAERIDIFKMIVGEGLALSLAGMVLGVAGALWVGQMGSSLLFGVAPTDLATYAAVSLLLTGVAVAGCYFPARRAARVDPLTALRFE